MKLKTVFCLLFFQCNVFPQSCYFDDFYKNKNLNQHLFISEQALQRHYEENFSHAASRHHITIPIVVHIVWRNKEQDISDVQIFSQIEALNRDFNGANLEVENLPEEFEGDFAKIDIEFCIASTDPQNNPTTGITRTQTSIENIATSGKIFFSDEGGKDAWDTERYLNVWVGEMREGILGFGSLPNTVGPEQDGVVVNYLYFGTAGVATFGEPYNLGRTLTHEVGHYLNLLHPWGLQKGDCDEDDLVDDTPIQSNTYKGCPSYPMTTCGENEMTMNFMNEVDDRCMVFFTQGQKERMLASLDLFRSGLLNGIECNNKSIFPQGEIRLFPNPATNLLNIETESDISDEGMVTVFDVMGRLLYSESILLNTIYPLNITLLENGLYFIKISSSNDEIIGMKKLVVSK